MKPNLQEVKRNHYVQEKLAAFLCVVTIMACCLCGCRQSDRVNYNLSKEADNFNVSRRLVAINTRTDKPILEVVGNFSISDNSSNELVITVEIERGVYKKHYVYLNSWVTYTVEDISGAFIDKYHYEVNFLPEMILPFTVTTND